MTDPKELILLVQNIVEQAMALRDKHTSETSAPVNYACIFTQSNEEYEKFLIIARTLGSVVHETNMGPVFRIRPLTTIAGDLELLKIRKPDPKRPERGDADFTLSDYQTFKNTYLHTPGFGIIARENMEMIELSDPNFNVLAYFSHPMLFDVLKLKKLA